MHHSLPVPVVAWPLFVLLTMCAAVSAARLLARAEDRETDLVHLVMNTVMAAMVLDAGTRFGHAWIGVAGVIAVVLGARLVVGRTLVSGVHFGAALVMLAMTDAMVNGIGWLTTVVLVITAADVVATAFALLAGHRLVVAAGVGPVDVRVATIPHLGMGIGMLAMLIGA